jgi:hypothetical protein
MLTPVEECMASDPQTDDTRIVALDTGYGSERYVRVPFIADEYHLDRRSVAGVPRLGCGALIEYTPKQSSRTKQAYGELIKAEPRSDMSPPSGPSEWAFELYAPGVTTTPLLSYSLGTSAFSALKGTQRLGRATSVSFYTQPFTREERLSDALMFIDALRPGETIIIDDDELTAATGAREYGVIDTDRWYVYLRTPSGERVSLHLGKYSGDVTMRYTGYYATDALLDERTDESPEESVSLTRTPAIFPSLYPTVDGKDSVIRFGRDPRVVDTRDAFGTRLGVSVGDRVAVRCESRHSDTEPFEAVGTVSDETVYYREDAASKSYESNPLADRLQAHGAATNDRGPGTHIEFDTGDRAEIREQYIFVTATQYHDESSLDDERGRELFDLRNDMVRLERR